MEWFNKITTKLQYFFMGLMLGLIVGGGFFIFKLDDYFKELRTYKNIFQEQKNNNIEEQSKEIGKASKTRNNKSFAKKNEDVSKITSFNDSVVQMANNDPGLLIDSLNVTVDSIIEMPHLKNNNEDVIVRKDELIAVKTVDIQNLNLTAENNSKKDSLLEQVSGIKSDAIKTFYKVEIWKSPLNYKGYKMAKNKLILYGIANHETLKLYQLDNDLYMKTPISTYKIEYSNEFRPLEKITDESVLVKLK